MLLNVREVTSLGVLSNDVFSEEFTGKRRIYITGEITSALAAEICASINYLASRNKEDIQLIIINSPGGEVTAGLAMIDAMRSCGCDICTVALGICASMAAVLSSSGTKGKRYIGENAGLMIHQALAGVTGQTTDILRAAEKIRKVNDKLFRILSENTGNPVSQISTDCDRDFYLESCEAIEYGLADCIFTGCE